MENTHTPDRIEAPAPITTPIRTLGAHGDQLIEYPDPLEITEIAEWSEGYRLTVTGHPDIDTLVLCAAEVMVSDERIAVSGWDIFPERAGEVVLDQPVGTAIPPEGDDASCWIDCYDAFTADSIKVLHEWLAR